MLTKIVNGQELRYDAGAVLSFEAAMAETEPDPFPDMPSKVCRTCHLSKKIIFFHRDNSSKDKHTGKCMTCANKSSKNGRVGNQVPCDETYRFNARYGVMR